MGKKVGEGESLRLFVALDLPEEVRERIAAAAERHAQLQPQARWVKKENLHLTLKFIGEFPADRMDRLVKALEETTARQRAFTASFGGCGGFPSVGKSRVIWVGMERGEGEAASLAAELNRGLVRVGVKKEARPFRGHLTLARLRSPADCSSWVAAMEEELAGLEEMTFMVEEVTLYRSILSPAGPTYMPLRRFGLRRDDGDPN